MIEMQPRERPAQWHGDMRPKTDDDCFFFPASQRLPLSMNNSSRLFDFAMQRKGFCACSSCIRPGAIRKHEESSTYSVVRIGVFRLNSPSPGLVACGEGRARLLA